MVITEKQIKIIGALAVALLALFLWYLFPSAKREIKRNLNFMAEQISFPQSEHPLESLKRGKLISEHLTSKLLVTVKYNNDTASKELNKSEVPQQIFALSKKISPLKVELKDFNISVSGQSATANFTAIVTRSKNNSDTKYAQEIKSFWGKLGGKWLLTELQNIEAIE